MKKFLASALSFAITISLFVMSPSMAYSDYSNVFLNAHSNYNRRLISPLAASQTDSTEKFPTVTSKWNEVRHTGTSPHIGVDLSVTSYNTVVAVADGYLRITNDAFNTITLEIEDDLFCHYEHMKKDSNLQAGNYDEGDIIGIASNYNTIDPDMGKHLHFAFCDIHGDRSSARKSYRTETFYRHVSQWNYGRNLDTFSQVQWINNRKAQITLVFSERNNNHNEKPGEVIMFHRLNGTNTWINGGSMTLTDANNFIYTYDFKDIYPSGSKIDWMVRYRRDRSDVTINYKYCWAPARFYQPSTNPNSTTLAYAFTTNTVSY